MKKLFTLVSLVSAIDLSAAAASSVLNDGGAQNAAMVLGGLKNDSAFAGAVGVDESFSFSMDSSALRDASATDLASSLGSSMSAATGSHSYSISSSFIGKIAQQGSYLSPVREASSASAASPAGAAAPDRLNDSRAWGHHAVMPNGPTDYDVFADLDIHAAAASAAGTAARADSGSSTEESSAGSRSSSRPSVSEGAASSFSVAPVAAAESSGLLVKRGRQKFSAESALPVEPARSSGRNVKPTWKVAENQESTAKRARQAEPASAVNDSFEEGLAAAWSAASEYDLQRQADWCSAQGKFAEAADFYEQAIAKAGATPSVEFLRDVGLKFLRLGMGDRATELFKQADLLSK